MELLPEVKKLFRGFHQGMELCASNLEEVAMCALAHLEPQDADIVKAFLDELLAGKFSPKQIQEIWHSSPADFYFLEAKDTVEALKLVRRGIDRYLIPSTLDSGDHKASE